MVFQTIAGRHQSVADADENIAVYAELAADQVCPLLIDMRQPLGTDPGVRDRYARVEFPNLVAIGLLISSGFGRIFGNLFLTFHRQRVPVRLFNDEAAAIAWLQKFTPSS